jgi:NTP pyrophosphatase (non-canonical NTP hydrolase)
MAGTAEEKRKSMSDHDGQDLDSLTGRTARLLSNRYSPWSPEIRCLDLLEETGELARAVLTVERHKQGGEAKPEEDISTAICGVLVDLLALADHYGISLATVYPQLLRQLDRKPH